MPEPKKVMPRDEKRIRKDERKKIRRRKRAKGSLYGLLVAIIAFLIMLGNGNISLNPFGYRSDGSGEFNVVNRRAEQESDDIENSEDIQENASDATKEGSSKSLSIAVDEKSYYHMDTAHDLDGIKELILAMEFGEERLELIDRYANSKTFDDLEMWLKEQSIEYNVVEEYE